MPAVFFTFNKLYVFWYDKFVLIFIIQFDFSCVLQLSVIKLSESQNASEMNFLLLSFISK
jgi:hypothetical protein